MKPEQAKAILAKEPAATFLDGEDATVVITHGGSAEFIVGEPTVSHALSDLRQIVEQAERIDALEKSLADITKGAWDSMTSIEKCNEAEKLLGE